MAKGDQRPELLHSTSDRFIIKRFRELEGEIIGRLVVGYGEIELGLCHCIAQGIGDLDMALKAMFRARGETSRIDIAEAMGQKVYVSLGIGAAFREAIDAVRFCLRIRNRYAHSHFYEDNSGKLAIVGLEEIAKKKIVINDLLRGLTIRHLTEEVLRRQEHYFLYTSACIDFVNCEGRFLRNKIKARVFEEAPQKIDRPAEYAQSN